MTHKPPKGLICAYRKFIVLHSPFCSLLRCRLCVRWINWPVQLCSQSNSYRHSRQLMSAAVTCPVTPHRVWSCDGPCRPSGCSELQRHPPCACTAACDPASVGVAGRPARTQTRVQAAGQQRTGQHRPPTPEHVLPPIVAPTDLWEAHRGGDRSPPPRRNYGLCHVETAIHPARTDGADHAKTCACCTGCGTHTLLHGASPGGHGEKHGSPKLPGPGGKGGLNTPTRRREECIVCYERSNARMGKCSHVVCTGEFSLGSLF